MVDPIEELTEEQILSDISKLSQSIPNESVVTMSHINDLRSFYVLPKCKQTDEYLKKLCNDLNAYGSSIESVNEFPSQRTVMLAKVNDQFYRIAILKVRSKFHPINVFFMDHGKKCEVSLYQLYNISDDLRQRKVFLNKIVLHGVSVNESNKYHERFLQALDTDTKLVLMYDNDAQEECFLYFMNDNISINQRINRINQLHNENRFENYDILPEISLTTKSIFFYVRNL